MQAIPNKVIIGGVEDPILTFYNDQIQDIIEETAVSPIGDELFIDQFVPTVGYGLIVKYFLVPADFTTYDKLVSADDYMLVSKYNYDIRNIPYGTPIRFYSEDKLRGLFYIDSVERQGKELFQINCVSAIGLMDKQRHKGGVYFGTRFDALLHEITGEEYEYEIDPSVGELQVFGWLPYSTRRRNLHQLLVAYGVTITKSDSGLMLFTFLNPTEFEEIASNRIFDGGSVEYGEPASRVELTEHSYYYLSTVEFKELFDTKGESVEHITVTFDEPIYPDSLETEGDITIHQFGVNYAVISGSGTLRGQAYIHNTKLLSQDNPDAMTEKIVTVDEATLITIANSENCLARISNYYFHATKVTQDIVVEDEKTGRRYRYDNPFHEKDVGVLSRMSINTSSFRRAECDFISGYTPMAQGSSFQRRELLELTEEGVRWNIPDVVREKDVQNIRLVLIGAGSDGQNGQDGEDGLLGDDNDGGLGGAGGTGGAGGVGGKVLSVTLNVENLEWITYGETGVNTWVQAGNDLYSSSNGYSSPSGFTDLFTGAVLALPGNDGYSGGAGGKGGIYLPIGGSGTKSTNGESVEINGSIYKGGAGGGRSVVDISSWAINDKVYAGGSGGGGAAYGKNGGDAVATEDGEGKGYGHGGDGADALNATPTLPMYGCGGNGGNGGGGGGGGEIVVWWNFVYTVIISKDSVNGGAGGHGSAGSSGYRGCLLIYY